MARKRLAVVNFGCQMNKHDAERIVGLMAREAYELTENARDADLIVLNTCAIREKSEQKVFSHLGRLRELKEKNPGTQIAVCGCVAQRAGSGISERMPIVDVVCGTDNIEKLPDLLRQAGEEQRCVVDVSVDASFDEPSVIQRQTEYAAFVSIIKGCNHRCTYCIVPLTRGVERSRPSRLIVQEVEQLAANGYKEATLIGQNVNSYGHDLPGECSFPALLEQVAAVPGIARVRFVTSHPANFSEALMETIARTDTLCKQLHLPVQSGSDRILRRMDRGYTAAEYLDKVRRMRALVPEMAFSTDLIVGFPGETDDDFQRTLALVEEVEYDSFFLFKYSPRPLTPAASMPDQVSETKKKERFDTLQRLQQGIQLKRNARYEGRIETVLVEGPSKKDAEKLTSRTASNKVVNFVGDLSLKGKLVPVEIVRAGLYSFEGRLAAHS